MPTPTKEYYLARGLRNETRKAADALNLAIGMAREIHHPSERDLTKALALALGSHRAAERHFSRVSLRFAPQADLLDEIGRIESDVDQALTEIKKRFSDGKAKDTRPGSENREIQGQPREGENHPEAEDHPES